MSRERKSLNAATATANTRFSGLAPACPPAPALRGSVAKIAVIMPTSTNTAIAR